MCSVIKTYSDCFSLLPKPYEIENFIKVCVKKYTDFIVVPDTTLKYISSVFKILELDHGSLAVSLDILARLSSGDGKINDFFPNLFCSVTLASQERDDLTYSVRDCCQLFVAGNNRPLSPEEKEIKKNLINKVETVFKQLQFIVCPINPEKVKIIQQNYLDAMMK